MRAISGSRTRVGRWLGLIVVLSLLTVACAEQGRIGQPSGDLPEYRFNQILVSPADASVATVTWTTVWATSKFPGVRFCTWTAYDAAGRAIGEYSDRLVSMNPQSGRSSIEMPVRGMPERASIRCDEQRLDVGGPYAYGFASISPLPPDDPESVWAISYDAEWLGTGAAGAVTCEAALVGSGGETLASEAVNVFAGEGFVQGAKVLLGIGSSDIAPSSVASAELRRCHPFTG